MVDLSYVAKFIVSVMKAYGFDPSIRYYPAGSMDNTLLRAIEGISIGDEGYIYLPGRDGQEYVSGGDRSLAIRWNGDRPNIPFLILGYEGIVKDYYDTIITLDKGGGYTEEQWIEPDEHGGASMIEHITYNHPIDDNMYVGVLAKVGDDATIDMCQVVASLLGNYMLINYHAPDRDARYRRLRNAIQSIIPSMKIGNAGQCKVPYYDAWVSI